MIIGVLLIIAVLVAPLAIGTTVSGSPTEAFYAGIINSFYGTNHTGRPVECGRDWTYYHYLATEMLVTLIVMLIHMTMSIIFFVKLWRRGGKTLSV